MNEKYDLPDQVWKDLNLGSLIAKAKHVQTYEETRLEIGNSVSVKGPIKGVICSFSASYLYTQTETVKNDHSILKSITTWQPRSINLNPLNTIEMTDDAECAIDNLEGTHFENKDEYKNFFKEIGTHFFTSVSPSPGFHPSKYLEIGDL